MGRAKGSRNPPGSRKPGRKPDKKYGEDVYAMTLDAVGQEFGVTRERIRQIEAKALAKLRAGLEARGIDEALWLDHLRDLHKRQRTHYTVSTEFIAVSRFRTVDEAEQAASCTDLQSA